MLLLNADFGNKMDCVQEYDDVVKLDFGTHIKVNKKRTFKPDLFMGFCRNEHIKPKRKLRGLYFGWILKEDIDIASDLIYLIFIFAAEVAKITCFREGLSIAPGL